MGIFILVLLALFFISEASTLYTYGWFISKKNIDLFLKIEASTFRFPTKNNTHLLVNGSSVYISKLSGCLLGKYYVSSMGIIPRWSKLQKVVDGYFDATLSKQLGI